MEDAGELQVPTVSKLRGDLSLVFQSLVANLWEEQLVRSFLPTELITLSNTQVGKESTGRT